MRPQPGDLISGKYRVVRLIGDGGMGSVFEARHEFLGTSVALKFLHPELARRAGLVARFLQEARLAASIRSPHIAHVTDVDQAPDGSAYLVMELLTGESLQGLLDRQRRLPRDTALDYTLQVLAGLEAAHAMGVVHRDLKPDNVFVVATPRGPWVKLLDFGIAKLRTSREFQAGLTRPGVVMGTPEYMAPEQAFSADTVDGRADIYAVGVMLFEMLVGQRPVQGDDPREIAARAMANRCTPIRQIDPSVPEALATAIHRAMAPAPTQRFGSVAELREAITPLCGALSLAGQLAVTPASPGATPDPGRVSAPLSLQSTAQATPGGVARTPTDTRPDDALAVAPQAPRRANGTAAAPPGPPAAASPGSVLASTAPMPAYTGQPPQAAPAGRGGTLPTPVRASTPLVYPYASAGGSYLSPGGPATNVGRGANASNARASRRRGPRGLSVGVLAALAGAAGVIIVVAVMALRSPDSESTSPIVPIASPVVSAVAATHPSVTNAPTAAALVPPANPSVTIPVSPPATASKPPAARRDAGAQAEAGAEPGLTLPQFPFPLPTQLPTALPSLPSSFPPLSIPGFPVPASSR